MTTTPAAIEWNLAGVIGRRHRGPDRQPAARQRLPWCGIDHRHADGDTVVLGGCGPHGGACPAARPITGTPTPGPGAERLPIAGTPTPTPWS